MRKQIKMEPMTNTLILANIGNRNIKYLNQGYVNDEIPKLVFFEKTKFLWEHPEELKHVSLCILPAILEEYPKAKLYLFSTLQEPVFNQDTYYEGLIIQKLLQEQYQLLQVESITIKGVRANSEDELIPWYRETIYNLIKIHSQAFYIMYDTGGTPQQKNALKSVVEFYLKRNEKESVGQTQQYKLFQGNDNHQGGTQIEEIQRTASEKLYQLTNIKLLIQHNNYSAAKDLALGLENKPLVWALSYASYRWENMWQEISKHFKFECLSKNIRSNGTCISLIKEGSPGESLPALANKLLPSVLRDCKNLLSKTYNQQASGNLSGAILSFCQFAESYVAGIIETNSVHKVYSNYRAGGVTLIREIENEFSDDYIDQFERPPANISFPVMIFFALRLLEKEQEEWRLINEIKATQSFFNISNHYPQNAKLDTLRNRIAHDGLGVSESDYKKYVDLINEIYKKFIPGSDPFNVINQLIEKLM